MRAARWIRFIIAILIGMGLGLYYGWFVSPVEFVDTAPSTLRQDYKTDFVLMVAEIYQNDGDLAAALNRLALLGDTSALEGAQQALEFATQAGYAQRDLDTLSALLQALIEHTSEAIP